MLSGLKIGQRKRRDLAGIAPAVDLHLRALRRGVDGHLSGNDYGARAAAFFLAFRDFACDGLATGGSVARLAAG